MHAIGFSFAIILQLILRKQIAGYKYQTQKDAWELSMSCEFHYTYVPLIIIRNLQCI